MKLCPTSRHQFIIDVRWTGIRSDLTNENPFGVLSMQCFSVNVAGKVSMFYFHPFLCHLPFYIAPMQKQAMCFQFPLSYRQTIVTHFVQKRETFPNPKHGISSTVYIPWLYLYLYQKSYIIKIQLQKYNGSNLQGRHAWFCKTSKQCNVSLSCSLNALASLSVCIFSS